MLTFSLDNAYAGLEAHYGKQCAVAFRTDVGMSGSKSLVVEASQQLGLDGLACAHTMAINDGTGAKDRVEALANILAV